MNTVTTRSSVLLGAGIGGVGVVLHHALGMSLTSAFLIAYGAVLLAVAIDIFTAERT